MEIFHKILPAIFEHDFLTAFDDYFGIIGAVSFVITDPSRIFTSRINLFDLQSIYMQAVDGCLSWLSILWVTKVADYVYMTID